MQLKAGKFRIVNQDFDLKLLLYEVFKMMKLPAEMKGITMFLKF